MQQNIMQMTEEIVVRLVRKGSENCLRSCGLSETFVLHLIRLGKLTLEISALFTSDILTSVD